RRPRRDTAIARAFGRRRGLPPAQPRRPPAARAVAARLRRALRLVQERSRIRRERMTLARAGFIPIPSGAKPGFDHADVYVRGRRIYVAHTGADRIEVLDCEQRTYLHALAAELPGVAGVLIDQEHDLLFSSDRAAARVSVFRCSDERLLGQVAVDPHPNGLAYDRWRRRLYSFNLGE